MDIPNRPFAFYVDAVEAVVALGKRRPCVVISNADEVWQTLIRVVPYYTAASRIVERNRRAIEEGRYPRFMVLPEAPWQTKENLLDFKAACMIPRGHLERAEQAGRMSASLFNAVRAQHSRYVLADRAELAAP